MRVALAALAFALAFQAPAQADVLVDNVDGLTLTADGTVQRFSGLLIDNNGRIAEIFQRGDKRPPRVDYRLDGKGRVLIPGLIDSHVELMELGFSRMPPENPTARPRPEDRDRALVEAQRLLLERGITTVADIGTSIEDWQTYRRAGDLGTLSLRIVGYATSVEDMLLIAGPGPTPWLYDDRLRLNGLRIDFTSATPPALPAKPARLANPRPAPRAPEPSIQLKNLLSRASIDRFQSAIIVSNPGLMTVLLDAIAELAQTYKGERRWRIAVNAPPPSIEFARLGQSGVAVDLLPHAQSSLASLGGAKIGATFGSATAAGAPQPFAAIASTVPREAALAAMTTGAAWAAFAEGRVGRIALGQRADFLLLEHDPLLAAASELRGLSVLQTWIGGKLVYQAPEAAIR